MPVSGLVLTLADDAVLRERACTLLRAQPRVTLGAPQLTRLPLVLESESAEAMEQELQALSELEGVELVELAYADFSDVQTYTIRPRRGAHARQSRQAGG
jgi:nitrate reductase NapAB chaperone NapD